VRRPTPNPPGPGVGRCLRRRRCQHNIGYFSLLFAERVGPSGKVIAIEAAPDTARRLRANVELNGAAGIVDVVEAACAPQQGQMTFYLHPRVADCSRLSPPAKGDFDRRFLGNTWIPRTVAADTLTSIVGADAPRVSFIKLDVEGAETAMTPQIAAGFSHPRLVVALEVRELIEATLMPFQEGGSTSTTCIMTTTGYTSARCRRSPRRHTATSIIAPSPTYSSAASPSPSPLGWGGSCFGKNLSSLITIARREGYEPALLTAAVEVNKRQHWARSAPLQSQSPGSIRKMTATSLIRNPPDVSRRASRL
jgi:FkbM family methyltransferase